jgi:hypothetical protein
MLVKPRAAGRPASWCWPTTMALGLSVLCERCMGSAKPGKSRKEERVPPGVSERTTGRTFLTNHSRLSTGTGRRSADQSSDVLGPPHAS